MKNILLILLCFIVSGCVSFANFRNENVRSLENVYTGMGKKELLDVMSKKESYGGKLSYKVPHKRTVLKGSQEDIEVLFYYMDSQSWDGAITHNKLVPFVFNNGELIG